MLALLDVDFEVVPAAVTELERGDPERVVVENARRKAAKTLAGLDRGATVLGVDTEVAVDGEVLGKPGDAEAARARLRTLAGRSHEVLSGVAVAGPGDEVQTAVELTAVSFRPLDDALLELYVRSGEWRDRAGGYAIQGLGSVLVERVDGDLSNVIGLPLRTVGRLLGLLP